MKIHLFGFFLMFAVLMQPSAKVPEALKQALSLGNTRELSQFFDTKIALTLLDDDDIYSRQEAIKKLEKFFVTYKPLSFTIEFEGGKNNNQYAIGILKTSNGEFRVSLLLQMNKITQLRIGKED